MYGVLATVLLAQSLFGGLPVDNITCDQMEGAVQHIHAHLTLVDRGTPLTIPAQVGISSGAGCLYWIHTHTSNGFIHIEAPVKRSFTLGEFFDIWGQDLSATRAASLNAKRLAVTVDGKPYPGDPRKIVLRDHESIVIEAGPPYVKTPAVDWSKV